MERMLTVREVADFLGVHENWVYDRAVAGELPSYKIGATRRFLRAELDSWLVACRQQVPTPRRRSRVA